MQMCMKHRFSHTHTEAHYGHKKIAMLRLLPNKLLGTLFFFLKEGYAH